MNIVREYVYIGLYVCILRNSKENDANVNCICNKSTLINQTATKTQTIPTIIINISMKDFMGCQPSNDGVLT